MHSAIVPYEDKYHGKLVEIWYRAVRETHSFLSEDDLQFYRSVVQGGALKELELWVEVDERNEPTAFIGLDGTKIEALFVDPARHGKGIGSRLVRHAEKIKGPTLQVDVNEQNGGAYAFYSRLGFVQIGRSERDGAGRPYPLLHLSKG
ncbi:MAG TPA: acetyltransferase [Paenibacillus sp.]|nr:acetyltransferase [Paenibacillus sp.]